MDETYIKMCDCEEIQELRPQVMIGSTPHYYKGTYQYEIDTDGNVRFWDGHKYIWLPLQHQLQEMLGGGWLGMLSRFWDFCSDTDEWENTTWFASYNLEKYTSMEQLWLAFVMKEKYDKTWDGASWICR